jgi:hypothetical protein
MPSAWRKLEGDDYPDGGVHLHWVEMRSLWRRPLALSTYRCGTLEKWGRVGVGLG